MSLENKTQQEQIKKDQQQEDIGLLKQDHNELLLTKQESFAEMKNANQEYQASIDKGILDAQEQLFSITQSAQNAVEKKEEIKNIMGSLRNLTTGNAFKRVLTSAAAYAMYFGVGTGEVKAETNIDMPTGIEISDETELANDDKRTYTFDGPNDEGNSLEGTSEDDKSKMLKFESRAGFELAKTDLDAADLESLNAEIEQFIEGFSSADLENIKSGQMMLIFEAGSSPEPIKAAIETSMGQVDNNLDLSKNRAEIFKAQVLEKLVEKGINNPVTSVQVSMVEGLEPGVSKSGERFASVSAIELSYENMVKFANTIIIDGSGSMINDKAAIEQIVANTGADTNIVDLETGRSQSGETLEYYLSTVLNQVQAAEQGDLLFMVGDEMADDFRNSTESIEDRKKAQIEIFKKIKEIAKEKGLSIISKRINIDNPDESIVNDFTKTGLMMTMGHDDADSYAKNKEYLEKRA